MRVRRPRVHGVDGRELKLETWKQFAEAVPLTPRAVEQMVLGVCTQKPTFARSSPRLRPQRRWQPQPQPSGRGQRAADRTTLLTQGAPVGARLS